MGCSIKRGSSKLCQICAKYGIMMDNSMNTQLNTTLSSRGDAH